jgi:hypothetical protein
MERYMARIGRRKLIVRLQRDLAATPEGKALAAQSTIGLAPVITR